MAVIAFEFAAVPCPILLVLVLFFLTAAACCMAPPNTIPEPRTGVVDEKEGVVVGEDSRSSAGGGGGGGRSPGSPAGKNPKLFKEAGSAGLEEACAASVAVAASFGIKKEKADGAAAEGSARGASVSESPSATAVWGASLAESLLKNEKALVVGPGTMEASVVLSLFRKPKAETLEVVLCVGAAEPVSAVAGSFALARSGDATLLISSPPNMIASNSESTVE